MKPPPKSKRTKPIPPYLVQMAQLSAPSLERLRDYQKDQGKQ
jgi:hypothetical protein